MECRGVARCTRGHFFNFLFKAGKLIADHDEGFDYDMSRARIVRSALSTKPQPGGGLGTFTLPCRKMVIEYCEKSAASKGTRDFLLNQLAPLARAHPTVEFVVQPRPQRAPLLRGFYCTCHD